MLNFLKELFFGKSKTDDASSAPYKIEPPVQAGDVAPQASVQADPVAVALDLEPMDFSVPAETAKKPRKPRAPKAAKTTAAKKTAAKKTTKKAK